LCRAKDTCSELGTDPQTWDIYCPLRKPSWMAEQINLIMSAVNDFFSGQKDACLHKISEIRSAEITNWYIEHGQMSGRHRKIILKTPQPKAIPESKRDLIRSPRKFQTQVFERDGYKCRYCGGKLISQEFIRFFIKELNSPAFQRGETNLNTHGIIHLTWPVADHVVPWNLGGRTNLDNLVSACTTCNYGKDGYTLEQIGIENPFKRLPIIDNWNGLYDKIILQKTE